MDQNQLGPQKFEKFRIGPDQDLQYFENLGSDWIPLN